MKKRALSIVLVLTFLLSVFLFCSTAFASSANQDGLTVDLSTNKNAYTAGEEINAFLVVKSNSGYNGKLSAKLIVPEGLKPVMGQLVNPEFELKLGEKTQMDYALETPTQPTTTAPTTVTTVPSTTVPVTTVPPVTTAAPPCSGMLLKMLALPPVNPG